MSRGKYESAKFRQASGVHLEPRRVKAEPYVHAADREGLKLKTLALMNPEERAKSIRLPRITAFVAPMFG